MSGTMERRRFLRKPHEGVTPGHLLFNDFYNRPDSISKTISQLVDRGALVPGTKGKLQTRITAVASVSPWFHIKVPTNRYCSLWHEIYFKHFGIVPTGCMNCWKLVMTTHKQPRRQRVTDLFRLRDLLLSLNMPSKCGCDVRLYTPQRYDGFIYADSLEEGQQYYQVFKPRLLKEFPNGNLILKRSCTEFEHRFGDSRTWDERQDWKAIEHYLDYIIEPHERYDMQGLEIHTDADTFRFWIEYAHSIGDASWKEALKTQGYEVPSRLFFDPVTYHEETD